MCSFSFQLSQFLFSGCVLKYIENYSSIRDLGYKLNSNMPEFEECRVIKLLNKKIKINENKSK